MVVAVVADTATATATATATTDTLRHRVAIIKGDAKRFPYGDFSMYPCIIATR